MAYGTPDFNPARGYLKELRARGLVRASARGVDLDAASAEAQLPLAKVLRAATPKRRSLSDVKEAAGLDAEDLSAALVCLSTHELVRIVNTEDGPEVELTADGEATLEA